MSIIKKTVALTTVFTTNILGLTIELNTYRECSSIEYGTYIMYITELKFKLLLAELHNDLLFFQKNFQPNNLNYFS